MRVPIGIKSLKNKKKGKYIVEYKKTGGVIKYTKKFTIPEKVLKCVTFLEKSKIYTFQIYEEVG